MQGPDYFTKETGRLERLLASGSVASNKMDEISKKLSVLSAFLPEAQEEE